LPTYRTDASFQAIGKKDASKLQNVPLGRRIEVSAAEEMDRRNFGVSMGSNLCIQYETMTLPSLA